MQTAHVNASKRNCQTSRFCRLWLRLWLRTGESRQLGHPKEQDGAAVPFQQPHPLFPLASSWGTLRWHTELSDTSDADFIHRPVCSNLKSSKGLIYRKLCYDPNLLIFHRVNLNLLHKTVPSCFLDDAWNPVDVHEPFHAREHSSSWLSFLTHQCLELDANDWSCSILVTATEIPPFIQPVFLQRPQQPSSNTRKGFRCLLWPTNIWTHHPSLPLACSVT